MSRILLKNVYYVQNKDTEEYMDIYFETNLGKIRKENRFKLAIFVVLRD